MKKRNGWHLYETGSDYDPQEFFRDVFNTLLDENLLEVEKKPEGYWWHLLNQPGKVTIKARPGQMLMISMCEDK